MKLISLFLLLFLIKSITSQISVDDFSINPFIEDLKNNGLFEIIELIKQTYGQDVAIISCEELNENRKGNCKKLVTEYIPPPEKTTRTELLNKVKCIKNLNFSWIIKKSNNIFDIKKDILSGKYNKNEANIIYGKITKRTGELPFCFYIK